MTIKNRFMRSPVWEGMSHPDTGVASEKLLNTMLDLAKGGVGLIIPGYVYISKRGQSLPCQTGMYDAKTADVWKGTIDKIHKEGSKIVFQICHGGNDSLCDEPIGCSYAPEFPKSRAMTIAEIEETIDLFINSAKMAQRAGADGVQLHGAHGYLLSEFMSPYSNRRLDKYGGSFENRIRIVKEIIEGVRKATGPSFSVGIKMNGHDCLETGKTPDLAAREVHELDLDFFEISCGFWNSTHTIRSIPRASFLEGLTQPQVERAIATVRKQSPKWPLSDGYTVPFASYIKKMNPEKIIAAVGGHRELEKMKEVLDNGYADIISMARPFIREPGLVNAFASGKKTKADCLSCGECIWRPKAPGGVKCRFPK